MPEAVTVTQRGDVAIVTIDNPPVNALGAAVRQGLDAAIDQVEADDSVRAAVLHCAGRSFAAGADISEFGKVRAKPLLPNLIDRIDACSKPWVAAMHGYALGGGFELAMGCAYRVARPDTVLGLPEVTLGLMPGAGGTVRLPRLIPLKTAYDYITKGTRFTAVKGLELGCIDTLSEGDLLDDAIAFAQRAEPKPPLLDSPVRDADTVTDWSALFAATMRRARGQISPMEAAHAVRRSAEMGARDALEQERAVFRDLTFSDQSAALRHLFFAERKAQKPAALNGEKGTAPRRVGVLGGGTMGAGIAAALLQAGISVVLVETDDDALAAAETRLSDLVQAAAQRGLLTPEHPDPMATLFTGGTNRLAFADCDMVIEAVFEDLDLKREIFAELDTIVRPDAVLATNTSYIDVNQIAAATTVPGRVIGIHFFAPAQVMKLIEVVQGHASTPKALAHAFALVRALGKIGVLAGACDGFIGNRIFAAYRSECVTLLDEGALPWEVDAALKDYGFAMGPFEVQDLSGHDIAQARRKRLAAAGLLPDGPSKLPDLMCELGRLGRKTGKGWYDYPDGTPLPSSEVETLILQHRGAAARTFTAQEIVDRAIARIVTEATAVVEEGFAEGPDAIDVVLANGYGFPRWRGGPMFASA